MSSQNNTDFSISDNAKRIGSETGLTILHEYKELVRIDYFILKININTYNRLFLL